MKELSQHSVQFGREQHEDIKEILIVALVDPPSETGLVARLIATIPPALIWLRCGDAGV